MRYGRGRVVYGSMGALQGRVCKSCELVKGEEGTIRRRSISYADRGKWNVSLLERFDIASRSEIELSSACVRAFQTFLSRQRALQHEGRGRTSSTWSSQLSELCDCAA